MVENFLRGGAPPCAVSRSALVTRRSLPEIGEKRWPAWGPRRRLARGPLARHLKNCFVLVALLGVACGGRTALDNERSSPPLASAGSGGAPDVWDWSQVVWDEPSIEAVSYLWTGSVNNTWAVVSDSVGSFHREHWDGARWTRTSAENNPGAPFDEAQVWAAANGEAFGGSSQQLQRWFGQAWSNWPGSPGCHALGGSALDDLWCASASELWRFDGARWSQQLRMRGIRGILALARNDVWVWGENGISHFDGMRWSLEFERVVTRMSASGPRDIWAVQDGNLMHSTGPGSAWTTQNPTGGQIAAVWSQAANNTWVVAAGAAMRWNGSSWDLMELATTDERLLISGSSEDVWIAGTLMLVHGHPLRK